MKKYEVTQWTTIKEHDLKVRKLFKIENNYPNLLKSTGEPIYVCCKRTLTKEEYKKKMDEWIEYSLQKTKEYKPTFDKIKVGTLIKGIRRTYKITRIKVTGFDEQIVWLTNTQNKKNRYRMLLYNVLELIHEKEVWKII